MGPAGKQAAVPHLHLLSSLSRDQLPGLDPEAAALGMTAQVNDLFARWIAAAPEQWLCVKRRWPRVAPADWAAARSRPPEHGQ